MNTHQVVEAYDLLRKREDLRAEQNRLPAQDAQLTLARVSLDLPSRGGYERQRGARVEFRGPTVGLIVDMLGSQLAREIDAIDRRLFDLGITEDMAAEIRKTEPAAACAEKEQDPNSIEIIVFGACPCDTCQTLRATA